MTPQDIQQLEKIFTKTLKSFKQDLYEDFATKSDIDVIEDKIPSEIQLALLLKRELRKFATKEEIGKFASKIDLKNVVEKSTKEITEVIREVMQEIEAKKADKVQAISLEVRVNTLEEKVLHN